MKFSLADPGSGPLIQGYGPDGFLIEGKRYDRSLILTPERILPDWRLPEITDLEADQVRDWLAFGPRIILIGTGHRQIFPPLDRYAVALEQGIGVEIMDTGAACRTYNILISEGRPVVAALRLD